VSLQDLSRPPDRSLWLDELRLPEFEELLALLHDEPELRSRLMTECPSPAAYATMRAIIDEARPAQPALLLHLLLGLRFLRKKKSRAIDDVAQAHFPTEVVSRLHNGAELVERLPAMLALLCLDPGLMVPLDAAHHWHQDRRCALEPAGPRRKSAAPLAEVVWTAVCAAALADLTCDHGNGRTDDLAYRLALPRRGGTEVLLAFRATARRDTVRRPSGRIAAGRRDEWVLLRLFDDGMRADLTARDLALGSTWPRPWRAACGSSRCSTIPCAGR
jgi:hypothetical protein